MATDALTLGSFLLSDPTGSAWKAGVEAEGTSRGAPVPIEVAVKSWLQDGSIVVTQGYDNREVNIRVRMWATTLTALCNAEAALFAEIGEPNLLTWTPTSGPAAVFKVVTSSMAQDDTTGNADLLAATMLIRSYNIRLTCEAFTQSATETVTASLPATGSTTTLLDACSATTGWTGFVDGGSVSPATAGGAVTLTATIAKGSHTYALQKTFAATTTSTNLLAVIWTPPVGKRNSTLSAIGDSVALPLIAEVPSGVAGKVKSYFKVAAASLAVTRLEWTGYADEAGSTVMSIDNVDVTDVKPINGTGRSQARTLLVGGSARAPATLTLESATAALGDVRLYVYDADDSTVAYSPSMRQFRSSGNTVTADAAQVSGSTEPINGTADNFQVPVGLWPRGSYLLVFRAKSTAGGVAAINYDTKTILGGNAVGASSKTVNVTLTTSYSIVVIDKLQLPTVDLPLTSTALMQIGLTTGTANVTYDEVWLFNTTIGNLIGVDCGTGAGTVGGSARRLFIRPATIATPRNTIRIGHSADGSDSFFPVGAVSSWGFPRFKGGTKSNVLAITPNATDATLSMANFNRWHTNPAN